MLGVPEEVLKRCGAVSEPVVKAMAEGALERSGADVAVAVSGIAGPGAVRRKSLWGPYGLPGLSGEDADGDDALSAGPRIFP